MPEPIPNSPSQHTAGDPAERSSVALVGFVTSKDGTTIGYRQYGAGPAIVLVQGAVGTTHSYHELAVALAQDFTVYVPERRGRPLSPRAYSPDRVVQREVEDVQALLEHSKAHFLFGLSSGAVIALEAARLLPAVEKLVLYEPPLYVPPQRMRFDLVERFNREIEMGRLPAAMVTALLTAEAAPSLLKFIPRVLLELILNTFLRLDARPKVRDYPPLRDVVPSMQYDFKVVSSLQDKFETFRAVKSAVLLLSSSGSSPYLRESSVALARVLPTSQRLVFQGLDHSGPWNADRGGKPQIVAAAMRTFLQA